ncbi:MAG: ATP-binding protein [Devosia sp.]
MNRVAQLWRTTTVRLTAIFIALFVVFSILLLTFIAYQSSIQIQQQQTAAIDREVEMLKRIDQRQGVRGTVFAVARLSGQPGPGIYYLGDSSGLQIAGNVTSFPANVLQDSGVFSFNYDRDSAYAGDNTRGYAVVRSLVLDSGLRLVVGRDVLERRGFTAIVFQGFLLAVAGILAFALLAGVVTARRVLKRIDTINATSAKIMSGNLSERIPVTKRNDEFDILATSLNAMLDRIEGLMQGLKEVTDNVAHDLKTPLTRLRTKAEAALRETDTALQREALETTLTESDRLIRTFNALLMIARAEAGAPSGAFADVDVSAVAADVAELYEPVAEEAGMALESRITPGVHLRANRELIGQALVNLIENALKYYEPAEDNTGLITVAVREDGGRVLIEVGDNGPGIPLEDRARVVERFVRLEKSRTEPGSGLGLSLVAAVARLHKGEFRIADNAPGVLAVIDLPSA